MVFSSLIFLFFYFTVTLTLYYVLPRRFRNALLFVVSLLFYSYGEPVFILLMIASVTVNYVFGLLIERAKGTSVKRMWLILDVAFNLGMLGFFKYAG
ncbi:MAG: MBOAT family protein, partial [Clostridia bacterium]|nr:MBOAT family protein [Clostridia bacterium]